jgi:hypothetical protein
MRRSIRFVLATALLLATLPASAALAAPSTCGRLNPGEFLARGESLVSCDGNDVLAHQADGNVVSYQEGDAIWDTNTDGDATSTLIMQGDGNLVLYAPDGRALWASDTSGNPGGFLDYVQGFLILRRADGEGIKLIPGFTFRP